MTLRWRELAFWLAAMPAIAIAQARTASPEYVATHHVAGVIRICGSPQMGDLLRLYEAGFKKAQPRVKFDDNLQSTVTAVAGVYTNSADIGLLGREIWPEEEHAFVAAEGHAPAVVEVATGSYDVPKATFALMIFVPRANPVASISMGQLARVFGGKAEHTWGELGLKGAWAKRPIHLYGFSRDNDKALVFSKLVFRNGDSWNGGLHEFANAAGSDGADAGELIVRAVEADPNAIGISNVHYATPGVRALPVSQGDHDTPIRPTRANVAARSYPLTRAVYMVLDSSSGHPPNDAVAEFMRFVLSQQGRDVVVQEGNYLPLTAEVAAAQLRSLGGQ